MLSALTLILAPLLLAQADPNGSDHPKIEQESQTRGLSFKLSPECHVELSVREDDKPSGKSSEKTYKADSIEEFRKKYPDVAKQYRIDRLLQGKQWTPLRSEDLDKKFEEWKLYFDGQWFWDRDQEDQLDRWMKALPKSLKSDEMNKWFEEQRKLFEKFRQLQPKVDPDQGSGPEASRSRPKLGILIAPVGDTLASQLGFDKVEGVIIASIQSGSLADRSGLRKDDIVTKINGKSIPDTAFFQKEILASPDGAQLEILRHGKHEAVHVKYHD